MMTSQIRGWGIVGILTVLALGAVAWRPILADPPPEPLKAEGLTAAQVEQQVLALGPQLQYEFCCNTKLTQAQRIQCAEYLAEMQYYPAIPAIMERITESSEAYDTDHPERRYAYTKALVIYGGAALPEVLEALEKNVDPFWKDRSRFERDKALGDVIEEAGLRKIALRLLRGRHAATLDRDRQALYRELIQRFTPTEEKK